jgi:Na+-transporting methylmalonyl-CoA/oxaloacetate decarboxylase gamma subunit
MIENMIHATNMQKGFFVMLIGILGVFTVLVVFFFLIKGLEKMFPEKEAQKQE